MPPSPPFPSVRRQSFKPPAEAFRKPNGALEYCAPGGGTPSIGVNKSAAFPCRYMDESFAS